MTADPTKIHQGPGLIWLGAKVPASGSRLIIDVGGNPTETGVIATPSAPGLSTVASVGATGQTVFVTVTLVNAAGETDASPESTLVVPAASLPVVVSPAQVSNAFGYNVYASDTTGTETLQNTAPIPIGQNYTLQDTLVTTGGSAPSTNTTAAVDGGSIDGATTVGFMPKTGEVKADQVFGPIDIRPIDAGASVEVTMEETDMKKLSFLIPGSAYSTGTDANLPVGLQSYEQLTYGGLFLIQKCSIAVISPRTDYPGKFVVTQLYKAAVTKPPQPAYSKEKPTLAKVTFGGIADPTRPAGDQIGTIWRQI